MILVTIVSNMESTPKVDYSLKEHL